MRALVLLAACSFAEPDYKTPGVGSIGAATVQDCLSVRGRYEPCGWVYWFPAVELELCIIWDDRAQVLGYPIGLLRAARSLYGSCEKATDARFAGSPVCWYQCPSQRGCQGTCFCLDEAS